jgi:uncharacterized cupin superfamily protein
MTAALMLHRADGAPLSTSFRRATFGQADPFARAREIAWEGPDSMSAGRVSFIGEVDVARFPHTETIVVVEGELRLRAPGAAPLVLGPGMGAVIACGTPVRIDAAARVRYVFCAAACDGAGKPGRQRRCWARRRNAAATTSSPTSRRDTAQAPGTRRPTTASFGRIA